MTGSNFRWRQYSNMYIFEEPLVICWQCLVNEAGGNVSVLCPLEQPGSGFRYQGDGGIQFQT
jgi:hypothetical protein